MSSRTSPTFVLPSSTMFFALVTLLILALSSVQATTLTYKMAPHEKACFYATAQKVDEKIAFYFAVQAGGNFDIDYEVKSPTGQIVLSGQKERQKDFVFQSAAIGDYSFCFSNTMSTFADKTVDFDITIEHEMQEWEKQDKNKVSAHKEALSPMETTLDKLAAALGNVQRYQKYFRTRENRNFGTVQSTESRIFWFSFIESGLMVGTAVLQVFFVRAFFRTTGPKYRPL